MKHPILFDMETSDPDDALTLCLLLDHPKVDLKAITVTPGSMEQIAVVKKIVSLFNKKIPVGAGNPNHPKQCVSDFHYKWLGQLGKDFDVLAAPLIYNTILENPDLTIITGGPLKNVRKAIEDYNIELKEIVVQGGFAGDNVVAEEDRLEKFKGKTTCPTFNLNGDVEGGKLVLSHPGIGKRYFVSKNVCHGVTYDNEFHERLRADKHNKLSNSIIWNCMEIYLNKHSHGKMLHDPLAAACLIDKAVCDFKEVEIYRSKGEWGSAVKAKTNTYITVKVYKDRFYNTLFRL
jgi:pyrimidine-specific ribonucleoside hydrolase